MVLLNDKIYKQTKNIILGKHNKSPLLIELSQWLLSVYAIKIVNIEFNKLPNTNKYRLGVIIEHTKDYEKMHVSRFQYNEEYQEQIAHQFKELALKHKFTDKSKLKEIFVSFVDFSEESKTEANWKAIKEIKEYLKSKYPVVWEVETIFSSSVIFYYTDADVIKNKNNDISKAITDDYYLILKKYDEFDYFTKRNLFLKFDSKENLDNNYEGSFFYYSR